MMVLDLLFREHKPENLQGFTSTTVLTLTKPIADMMIIFVDIFYVFFDAADRQLFPAARDFLLDYQQHTVFLWRWTWTAGTHKGINPCTCIVSKCAFLTCWLCF